MGDIESRAQWLERVLEISRELTSTLSLEPLLRKTVEAAAELTDSEAASILLLDDRSGELRFVASSVLADQFTDVPVPIESSIAGAVFSSGSSLIVPDVHADPRYWAVVECQVGFEKRSLLATPLQFEDRRIGVLEAENKRDDEGFGPRDVEMLTALAAQATIAIANARSVERLREARNLAEALRQASAALGSTLSYDEVLNRILEQVDHVLPRLRRTLCSSRALKWSASFAGTATNSWGSRRRTPPSALKFPTWPGCAGWSRPASLWSFPTWSAMRNG